MMRSKRKKLIVHEVEMTFFQSKIEIALKLLNGPTKETNKIDLHGKSSVLRFICFTERFFLGHDLDEISDDDAVALATALRSNTTIEELDIRGKHSLCDMIIFS